MRRIRALSLIAALALVGAACGDNAASTGSSTPAATSATSGAATGAGTGGKAVGFIFVGPKDDFGYNQAAYQGSQEVKKAYPNLDVITAENVPEDDKATQVMEDMVAKGAKIIFATSYGHKDPGLKVAAAHPDVVVVSQGNFVDGKMPANFGTYFGTVYEPVYLAGIAAGKSTKSNKLGYVYAFPIPQTLANISAFELGAKSVNPDAKTYVVNTSNWCDPAKQAEAANSLISQGIDVLTQHQDCTKTVIATAEAKGAMTVGYHADASALAPKGWLTGSEWKWGPMYIDIVKTIVDGKFTGSKYNANYRVGYKDGENPFIQSKFGSLVTSDTQKLIADAKTKISAATGSPFVGPLKDQDGKELVAAGKVPTYDEVEKIFASSLVDGVIGKIPKT
ncbi:MAG: BMP family ABC transporter substrate-binding protein [Actinobacteria bacterium]|nr:MAG: BMP family ABC transporter substrate-binding protein [Actinomycetota bacterium]